MQSIKQGDIGQAIRATLTWSGQDLTQISAVHFSMRQRQGSKLVRHEAAVVSATETQIVVEHLLSEDDSDTPGTYDIEWSAEWPGGQVKTFPSDSYNELQIQPKL